ncbi:hypothetical protein Tco_0278204 [Tanacetum coccineum]
MWNSSPIPTYSNNDTFENMFAHGIQNHEQPESIPDTYVVNENNSNIISDIPNMDPDRGKEEHDDVDNEQERALFASLDVSVDQKIISKEELESETEKRLKVKQRKSSLPLVKEMKDDLNCVMSLEDEFDEKCLILDIQIEFFKSQFESTMLESHNHVYENEMFEQNSSLKSEIHCLKKTITELSKHVADVKKEMTKRCAQYEKDFAKLEAHYISLELKSQNKSLTYVQNGHVLNQNSDEAKIKF